MNDKTTNRIYNGMVLLIFILSLLMYYLLYINYQKEKELNQRTKTIETKIELMEKLVDKVTQPAKEGSHDSKK